MIYNARLASKTLVKGMIWHRLLSLVQVLLVLAQF